MDARMTRIGLTARPTRIAAPSTGAANRRDGTRGPAIETCLAAGTRRASQTIFLFPAAAFRSALATRALEIVWP